MFMFSFSPPNYVSDEARLVEVLLDRYRDNRRLSRPVLNASTTIKVDFELWLLQIADFDEKNQKLSTLIWKKQVNIN